MAGIQKAGLQPTAIANLAMVGAAVAVGARSIYGFQISEQLEESKAGIEAITRELQRGTQRQASEFL